MNLTGKMANIKRLKTEKVLKKEEKWAWRNAKFKLFESHLLAENL